MTEGERGGERTGGGDSGEKKLNGGDEGQRNQRVRPCEESCLQVPCLLSGALSSLLLSGLLKEVPPWEGKLVIFTSACQLETLPAFQCRITVSQFPH